MKKMIVLFTALALALPLSTTLAQEYDAPTAPTEQALTPEKKEITEEMKEKKDAMKGEWRTPGGKKQEIEVVATSTTATETAE